MPYGKAYRDSCDTGKELRKVWNFWITTLHQGTSDRTQAPEEQVFGSILLVNIGGHLIMSRLLGKKCILHTIKRKNKVHWSDVLL